jgi:hypothetical protein
MPQRMLTAGVDEVRFMAAFMGGSGALVKLWRRPRLDGRLPLLS